MKKIDILNFITDFRKTPNSIKTYQQLVDHLGAHHEPTMTKFQAPNSKHQVPGFRFQAPMPIAIGTKLQVPSLRFQVSGFRFQVSGFRSKLWDLGFGIWDLVLGIYPVAIHGIHV